MTSKSKHLRSHTLYQSIANEVSAIVAWLNRSKTITLTRHALNWCLHYFCKVSALLYLQWLFNKNFLRNIQLGFAPHTNLRYFLLLLTTGLAHYTLLLSKVFAYFINHFQEKYYFSWDYTRNYLRFCRWNFAMSNSEFNFLPLIYDILRRYLWVEYIL